MHKKLPVSFALLHVTRQRHGVRWTVTETKSQADTVTKTQSLTDRVTETNSQTDRVVETQTE